MKCSCCGHEITKEDLSYDSHIYMGGFSVMVEVLCPACSCVGETKRLFAEEELDWEEG